MFTFGDAAAIASVCIPASAVWVAVINAKKRNDPNGNGNGKRGGVTPELCEEKHRSIDTRFASVEKKLDIILQAVTERRG